MPKITVNGVSLAYEILGDEGLSVVLTSGGRADKEACRPAAEALSLRFRVLIYDRRYCGASGVSNSKCS